MREEPLRKQARKLFETLEQDEQVIGTSSDYIYDKSSSYLDCSTLLVKKTKNSKRIANIIKEETVRDPLTVKKKDFTLLTWQFFPA